MVNGFTKTGLLLLLSMLSLMGHAANYVVKATELELDLTDRSQVSSTILDQNGERCALIKFETPIPDYFTFDLGNNRQIEKREDKETEIWIWISPDIRKMTIQCPGCLPLKEYRLKPESGNVYRAKLTTGLPAETASTQYYNIHCNQYPFYVSIDGGAPVECEKNLYNTKLQIGSHDIVVTAKYYKSVSKKVNLIRARACHDTLNLERNYASFVVSSEVKGFKVLVDGEPCRMAGTLLRLEPGHHHLVFRKEKYIPFIKDVDCENGEESSLKVVLEPNFITLNITAKDPLIELWIDGERIPGSSQFTYQLDLGSHIIQGRREGYEDWTYSTTNFTSSSSKVIAIPNLEQQFGTLTLNVTPTDAQVKLDGKLINVRSGYYSNNKTPVGTHRIQVSCEDYRPFEEDVIIVKGQTSIRDYSLIKVPTGKAHLITDEGISINLKDEFDNIIFKGTSDWTGKLPVGQNTIVLIDEHGVEFDYTVFMDEDKSTKKKLPFYRTLQVKPNVSKTEITAESSTGLVQTLRANKKTFLAPTSYEISITKANYSPYTQSIDLTKQSASVLRAYLTKPGSSSSYRPNSSSSPSSSSSSSSSDPSSSSSSTKERARDKFYTHSGYGYIGVVDMGYIYSCMDNTHWVTIGMLPFRRKMFGMSLFDIELSLSPFAKTIAYRPLMQLFIPVSKGIALTPYVGASVDLGYVLQKVMPKPLDINTDFFCSALAGLSFRINGLANMPLDIFAEYRYPVVGDVQAQGVYVGMSLSLGADL